MTHPPTNDDHSSVRTSIVAGLVVVLLLIVAALNLPKATPPYITLYMGLNVYDGPSSTIWSPPIASLGTNSKIKVLARSPDGLWFKIPYPYRVGWVYVPYTILSSDPAKLPVDAGPPAANLVLRNVRFRDPLPLNCGQTVSISVDIDNVGNEATTSSGHISIHDESRGQSDKVTVTTGTTGVFPPIGSGQSITVNDLTLTVSSLVGEYHWLYITISLDDDVPDINSMNNTQSFTYQLQGDCG